jgi:hypothetical protein
MREAERWAGGPLDKFWISLLLKRPGGEYQELVTQEGRQPMEIDDQDVQFEFTLRQNVEDHGEIVSGAFSRQQDGQLIKATALDLSKESRSGPLQSGSKYFVTQHWVKVRGINL